MTKMIVEEQDVFIPALPWYNVLAPKQGLTIVRYKLIAMST